MTNEQIVTQLQAGTGDREGLLTALYENNTGILWKLARHYVGEQDPEDLIQEGFIGLLTAAERYDSSQGVKFLTYALYWVRQYMRRFLLSAAGAPEYLQNLIRFVSRSAAAFERQHGREPTEEELSAFCNVSPEELDRVRTAEKTLKPVSADCPLSDEPDSAKLLDMIPAAGDSISAAEDRLYNRRRAREVWQVVAEVLPEEQADAIRGHYGYRLTYDEIAIARKTTPENVKKACAHALRTLRKPATVRKLSVWTDSDILAAGMRGTGAGSFRVTWTSATEKAAIKGTRRNE